MPASAPPTYAPNAIAPSSRCTNAARRSPACVSQVVPNTAGASRSAARRIARQPAAYAAASRLVSNDGADAGWVMTALQARKSDSSDGTPAGARLG
ncbi:rex protein [Burkholderia pseudomallei MSHR6137]|nr:rex protein [Burkholderia pseudomallei MSHR6137]